MRNLVTGILVALAISPSLPLIGCSRASTCDLSGSLALDGRGQSDAVNGDYPQSAAEFDQAAQGLASCAEAYSGADHYRTLYQEAEALGGEARSLFQVDEARAHDVVDRQTSILRDLADDPNADVQTNATSSLSIRALAKAQVEPSSQSSAGLPMPTPDYFTSDAAQKHCPSDLVVYVEWPSPYFYAVSSYEHPSRNGAFVCKADAVATDYAPAAGM